MRRQEDEMYNDDDDDDDDDEDDDDDDGGGDEDDDDEEEDRNTRGRPRSAAGARKLPPLALGDFGGKYMKKEGQTTTTSCKLP